MNKLFIPSVLAIIAITMVLAPTFATANAQEQVKPDTSKVCKTKVQVKALNTVNGTDYTATLADKELTKTAEGKSLQFTFNFNKSPSCPAKGSVLIGDVNGNEFQVTIKPTNSPTKVSVTLPDEPVVVPPPVVNNTNSTT
jgi:hypothetical protein